MTDFAVEFAAEFENDGEFSGTLSFQEPLSKHTYYRIGGPASLLASPRSQADLHWLAKRVTKTQASVFILGAGSNLLVSDQGFTGLVIKTTRLNLGLQPVGETILRTGTSVAVSTLLRTAAQKGWAGLEFLGGIPGSIGGVVTMNAGTHLGEVKDALQSIQVYSLRDQKTRTVLASEFRYRYRHNDFLQPNVDVVLSADWAIRLEDPAIVRTRLDEILTRRKNSQPVEYPSCGSVFKNPPGFHAWQVIEKLGLRGYRIGNAQFAEKHCNFIINLGSARAEDVKGLIDLAKSRAQAELNVVLEEEVCYLG